MTMTLTRVFSRATTAILVATAAFVWTPFAMANSSDEITWYKPEFPPLSIVNGPFAGKGYSDQIEAYLIEQLSTYKHKMLVAPFKRTLRDMKKGLNACSVTLLKTPAREQFIAFTKPARLLLPNSIIIRSNDTNRFKTMISNDGKISAAQVMQDQHIRFGYSNGRSYTKPLDNLLSQYNGAPNLIERLGKEGPKGLLSMLSKGHIDAMFAQPVEAQYHGRLMGVGEMIAVIPITETKDFTVGYIGCSKTPWGEDVIKQINNVLNDAVKNPTFRAFYEDFLDQESIIRYRKVYNKFFDIK